MRTRTILAAAAIRGVALLGPTTGTGRAGKYRTVGNLIKLSDSPAEVRRSPLLGEPTEELFRTVLGCEDQESAAARQQGAI